MEAKTMASPELKYGDSRQNIGRTEPLRQLCAERSQMSE